MTGSGLVRLTLESGAPWAFPVEQFASVEGRDEGGAIVRRVVPGLGEDALTHPVWEGFWDVCRAVERARGNAAPVTEAEIRGHLSAPIEDFADRFRDIGWRSLDYLTALLRAETEGEARPAYLAVLHRALADRHYQPDAVDFRVATAPNRDDEFRQAVRALPGFVGAQLGRVRVDLQGRTRADVFRSLLALPGVEMVNGLRGVGGNSTPAALGCDGCAYSFGGKGCRNPAWPRVGRSWLDTNTTADGTPKPGAPGCPVRVAVLDAMTDPLMSSEQGRAADAPAEPSAPIDASRLRAAVLEEAAKACDDVDAYQLGYVTPHAGVIRALSTKSARLVDRSPTVAPEEPCVERRAHCGVDYPAPVGHHHTAEECAAAFADLLDERTVQGDAANRLCEWDDHCSEQRGDLRQRLRGSGQAQRALGSVAALAAQTLEHDLAAERQRLEAVVRGDREAVTAEVTKLRASRKAAGGAS